MVRKTKLYLALAIALQMFIGGLAIGQDKYPSKPIQVIVPFAAGGSNDLLARAVEKIWTKYSSQPMVVVNKPGASGILGTQAVVQSKPDGYMLTMGQGSSQDLTVPQFQKMPYDPINDLIPVARLSVHSVVICVGANSPIKSIKDLVKYAKAGNQVTAGASAANGVVDIALKALAKRGGFAISTVPFNGSAEAVIALAGGHLTISGGHPSEVIPHIKAGRFRAIGVCLNKRDPIMPKVPTLKEQGLDVTTWGTVKGVAVPKGTPKEVVTYLSSTLKKVCQDPEFIKIMNDLGQPIMYQDSAEWTKFIKTAYMDYSKLIDELGLKK